MPQQKPGSFWRLQVYMEMYTLKHILPPKFNMEPENDGFQEELPFLGTSFQVPCWFGGVLAKQHIPSKDLLLFWNGTIQTSGPEIHENPIGSMYGIFITHRIHIWYIYLHLVEFYGKCSWIYHTWILYRLGFWRSGCNRYHDVGSPWENPNQKPTEEYPCLDVPGRNQPRTFHGLGHFEEHRSSKICKISAFW